jgi:hypothetical protein
MMDTMQYKFSDIPSQQPSMFANIPLSETMLAIEMFDFKKAMEDSFQMNGKAMDEVGQYVTGAKQYIAMTTGLDIEKDIFNLMDQEVSFTIQYEKGSLIPHITLLVNIAGHAENASKIIRSIDHGIDTVMQQLQQEGAPDSFLRKEKIHMGQTAMTKATLNIMQTVPPDMVMNPSAKSMLEKSILSLTYGITGDNALMITTDNRMSETYGKSSITSEPALADGLQRIGKQTQGFSFFNVTNTLGYVDQIISYIDTLEPMTSNDKDSYTKIVNMIRPLKYLIFSSTSNAYDTTSTSFIKIAP